MSKKSIEWYEVKLKEANLRIKVLEQKLDDARLHCATRIFELEEALEIHRVYINSKLILNDKHGARDGLVDGEVFDGKVEELDEILEILGE